MNDDFYIEDNNFLTLEQKKTINNVVLSDNFPFYYNQNALPYDKLGYFVHNILIRPELRKENESGINSSFYNFFEDLFKTFCNKNKINYNEILRMSVNLTFNNGDEKSEIHKDHNFSHKQLLLYLNDLEDAGGETYILNEDKKSVWKTVKPEKFKGVCFGWKYHYAVLPKKGIRVLAVFTFK